MAVPGNSSILLDGSNYKHGKDKLNKFQEMKVCLYTECWPDVSKISAYGSSQLCRERQEHVDKLKDIVLTVFNCSYKKWMTHHKYGTAQKVDESIVCLMKSLVSSS